MSKFKRALFILCRFFIIDTPITQFIVVFFIHKGSVDYNESNKMENIKEYIDWKKNKMGCVEVDLMWCFVVRDF